MNNYLADACSPSIILSMNRRSKVKIKWSPNFAYAIGIITTDGNLSIDGRHINITSKDKEILLKSKICLGINNKIGRKSRGVSEDKKYYVLQFGDINFYEFLLKIGLMPGKSKKLTSLKIPTKYFSDFLRGCVDGDGTIVLANHPESRHKQLRLRLYSASLNFASWMMNEIKRTAKCKGGWIYSAKKKVVHAVCFGKEDSTKIIKFMYYNRVESYLQRKYKIAKEFIGQVA